MSELNEIFEIPKEPEPEKSLDAPKPEPEKPLEAPKEKVVKPKKPKKPLTDERKLQLKEQLAKGRATALKNRQAKAQEKLKKKNFVDNDLHAEIKKLKTQIDKITTKPEKEEKPAEKSLDAPKKSVDAPKKSVDAPPVKDIEDIVEKPVEKSQPKPEPKPVPKKRVHKLGKFDYSQYF